MIKMSQTIDIILQPIYAIKIVRIKQKRNKMCKDNHNDIYDANNNNNNSNNKSQFDLRKILVL